MTTSRYDLARPFIKAPTIYILFEALRIEDNEERIKVKKKGNCIENMISVFQKYTVWKTWFHSSRK